MPGLRPVTVPEPEPLQLPPLSVASVSWRRGGGTLLSEDAEVTVHVSRLQISPEGWKIISQSNQLG